MITLNARKEFAELAEAAGTSLQKLLRDAADSATEEGTTAAEAIDHDERVIEHAKMRIQRNQIVLSHASAVLRLVKKYVN